jgi:hypothetical protein
LCEQLTAPDLTYTLVRPLEEKYNAIQKQGNKSVVFCFLLNRVRFYRDQNLTTAALVSLQGHYMRDIGNSNHATTRG